MHILQLSNFNVFFSLEKVILYQGHYQTLFLINFAVKSEGKKVQIVYQNHGLTPLQKMQILQLSNINVFLV